MSTVTEADFEMVKRNVMEVLEANMGCKKFCGLFAPLDFYV
jgi:hypothetical protein